MHRFLRSIGFGNLTREQAKQLVYDTVGKADRRGYTIDSDEVMIAEFTREYGDNIGICVSGTFDDQDTFHPDYYYPYLRGQGVTSYEDVTVERHAAGDSYAGVVDDLRVGISLVFYLQNKIPYVKALSAGQLPLRGTSLTLSALSTGGNIILPLLKAPDDVERLKKDSSRRVKLMNDARGGDETAIETLTLEDMDLYAEVTKRMHDEDVFSLVDTTLMPYGVECDQYMIVGEITEIRKVDNHITGEEVYILSVLVNDLTFDVAINIMDLVGEPLVGRRFKGAIWLQGRINFPETAI